MLVPIKPWPQLGIDWLTYVCLGATSAHITFGQQCLFCWSLSNVLFSFDCQKRRWGTIISNTISIIISSPNSNFIQFFPNSRLLTHYRLLANSFAQITFTRHLLIHDTTSNWFSKAPIWEITENHLSGINVTWMGISEHVFKKIVTVGDLIFAQRSLP